MLCNLLTFTELLFCSVQCSRDRSIRRYYRRLLEQFVACTELKAIVHIDKPAGMLLITASTAIQHCTCTSIIHHGQVFGTEAVFAVRGR